MPISIALVNLTNSEIRINDLGTRLLGPSGTSFDITGFFLPEELRQSEDLYNLAVSGSVTLSGLEGITAISEVLEFFDGGQFQGQNFTTGGQDLRTLRNTEVVGSDHVLVTSGVGGEGVVIYTVATAPQVVTEALVGSGAVTVTSGSNVITISVPIEGTDVDEIIVSGTSHTGSVTLEGDGLVHLQPDTPSTGSITIVGRPGFQIEDGIPTVSGISITRQNYNYSRSGNTDGTYLGAGVVSNSDSGWPMPRDGSVTAVGFFYLGGGGTASTKAISIVRNGDTVLTLYDFTAAKEVTFSDNNISADFNEGDLLQVYVSSAGKKINSPTCTVEVAWRF